MRKNGGGHGDHDRDRGPSWRNVALFAALGGWALADAPGLC